MNILITGAAGFIGFHLSNLFLNHNHKVIGIDNLNSYYSPVLKQKRLKDIEKYKDHNYENWIFYKLSLENKKDLETISRKYNIKIVINLAAQAGVRHSIKHPEDYIVSNINGFLNILELCRDLKVENFVYASSSSVYGGNQKLPFKESDVTDHQLNLYGATKKANESMAHCYSNLFNIPSTSLRFFTVYGPWGRPDMAPMIFAKSILENKPIKVFNFGNMKRDFTYIDDIAKAVVACVKKPATINHKFDREQPNLGSSFVPHRIFNVGNSKPVNLNYFIQLLEKYIGKRAIKQYLPMQPGEVIDTCSNSENLYKWINFIPETEIEEGVRKFVEWFLKYEN